MRICYVISFVRYNTKREMDVSMLIEVHQHYINHLKQKIRDNKKNNTPPTIVVSAPKISDNRACAPAKLVTLETERV